jgi:glycosyltransferase involved in cell wall biosynthesis
MKILSIIQTKELSYGGPINLLNLQKLNLKEKCQISILPTDRINLWLLILLLFGFKKKKFFYKFSIIHFHDIWNYKNILIAHFLKKKSIPYLFSLHGLFDKWSLRQNFLIKKIIFFLFLKNIFSRNSCIQISTIEEFKEAKISINTTKNFFIIPNGIDRKYFRKNPKTLRKNIVNFVFFGRIHQKKGIELLIESFCMLLKDPMSRVINFQLNIIGPGNKTYVNKICNLINKKKLCGRIKILDPVYNDTSKVRFLNEQDIFILPSFEEADSVALKEALALGLPVIISEQCRLEDVRKFDCGLIVKNDILNIFYGLKEILNKDFSNMSLNAINLIKTKYDSKLINNDLYNIYLDIYHGTRFSKSWVVNYN